jgi:plasmid stabilization system protein ParE
MNYEFHPEAELELLEQGLLYESAAPGLGSRFGNEVQRAVEVLLDHPGLGAPLEGELRHFVLRDFPHAIVYAVIGDLLYIIAVAHGCRAPGYWASRVSEPGVAG